MIMLHSSKYLFIVSVVMCTALFLTSFLFGRRYRSTTYVDTAAVTDQVAWSVCRSATLVSPAKTAELMDMPFGLRTRVGPANHVLHGGPDPAWEVAIFRGERGVPL